ncbi:MAG: tetratricopeptide repeat protein, partial [Desulfobulbaceae bacterium]|nr:tetratricopeptide repeat protein [Desulfobulbaceae bacterium]
MYQKTTILSVFYYLLIFYSVSFLFNDSLLSSAVAADTQPLVYSVRLMDAFDIDDKNEAEEELQEVLALGLDCRLEEQASVSGGKGKINILCGKASTINGLQDTVKTIRDNQYTFLIITTREVTPKPVVDVVSSQLKDTPEPETSASEIIRSKKKEIKPGDIVYTLRLSNTYSQDSLDEGRDQLDHLKELGLDCRLQESSSAIGRAAGKMYYVLCGQAGAINGLQETVNRARKNHLTFLITLAPYSLDHRLEDDFAGLPTVVPSINAEEQSKEVAAAFSRFNAGDMGKAETLFKDILEKEPGNIDASFGLSLVEVRRKNWAQAYVYIKPLLKQTKRKDIHSTATMIKYNKELAMGWDLVKTSPDKAIEAFMRARNWDRTPETMEGLAYAYYHKGNYKEALTIFEDIFAKSQDSHAAEMIISCYEKMEENDKLLAFYRSLDTDIRSVMSFNPERKQNLLAARQYIEAGEYNMAERLLKEIYLLEPGNAEILNYFGWLYLKKRNPVKAEEYYRSALSLDPYNIDIMHGLAGSLLALHREEDALIYLEKVQESGRDVVNEFNKAKLAIYIRKHQYIQALSIANQMEQKNPNDPQVHLLIAELYMNKNEREKAFNYYTRAYQLDNENFGVKINLLKYFLQDGRYDQIKLMLETFKGFTFTKDELSVLREFYLGYYDQYSAYLLANEEYESAKLVALSGLDLSPDDLTFLNRVAWVSLNMQDFERAAYYFQLALRQDPENIELWYGLGLCYLSVGDDESAAQTLSQVENSNNVEVLYKLADAYQQIERYEDALRVADRANQLSNRVHHTSRVINPKVSHAMPGIVGASGGNGTAVPKHVSKRDRLDVFNPFITGNARSGDTGEGGVRIPKFDFKTVAPTGVNESRQPFEREVVKKSSLPEPLPMSAAPNKIEYKRAEEKQDSVLGPSPMLVPDESDAGQFQKKKNIRS